MADKQYVLNKIQTTSRFLRANLAHDLQKEGLYPGQDNVLLILSSKGEISLGQLANELDVRPPTVTKTILRLAKQGFVQKNISTEDQRQSFVSLTQKGIDVVHKLETHLQSIEKAALTGINDDEVKLLSDILERIENNLT